MITTNISTNFDFLAEFVEMCVFKNSFFCEIYKNRDEICHIHLNFKVDCQQNLRR